MTDTKQPYDAIVVTHYRGGREVYAATYDATDHYVAKRGKVLGVLSQTCLDVCGGLDGLTMAHYRTIRGALEEHEKEELKDSSFRAFCGACDLEEAERKEGSQ